MVQPATGAKPQGRPRGLYYGWKVVFALFMAGFMVYGGGLYSFVQIGQRLTDEFHWTQAATSGLVTAFWISAPLILFGGYGIKRLGAVRMLVIGMLLAAVCIALLSTVSSFRQMYLLRVLMGLGKVMFAVTLPYAVSRWFSRGYSLALGITWAGWHVGGLVLAPLTAVIIGHFGWRAACVAIAVGIVTLGLVPMLATRRFRSPRDCGLALDGETLDTASGRQPSDSPVIGAQDAPAGTLGALLGAPVFWIVALVTFFFYMTYGGLLTQEAAVVEGAGYSPLFAAVVLGSTAGFAALGGLAVGWMLDRFSTRRVGIAMHLLLLAGALSLLVVGRSHSSAALVTYAVCFGVTIGGGDLYFVAVLRRRFPDISVAFSYSAWYFCEIFSLAVSGPAAGHVFDLTGNYDRTLALLAGSAVAALALALPVLRGPGLGKPNRAVA